MRKDLRIKEVKKAIYPMLKRVVIIGCGGIGGHLWDWIAHETWSRIKMNDMDSDKWRPYFKEFLFVDNDVVEEKNLFRQSFFPEQVGMPKAEALASKYRDELLSLNVSIKTKREWLDENSSFLKERDLILLCVDNHATRKILNQKIKPDKFNTPFNNMVIVNGGNSDSLVTVQVMLISRGQINTASLEHMHPEITTPEDEHPRDTSCMDITSALQDPQLYRANLMAAMQMFQIFVNILEKNPVDFCELWMNVSNNSFRKEPIPEKEIIV